ncbi:MAG TPA: hypothetical protein VEQ42_09120 [Pyrinomonadaceae bacterium]|nr:hypothetical protein [Pyrinomonadaceae bacterium]
MKTEARRSRRPPPNSSEDMLAPKPSEDVLTWAEVQRTHRIRNGVYQRRGRLVSLLTDFGLINPCYPDRHEGGDADTILYVGEGRRGDQHLTPGNRALLAAVESGHAVPLFNKLSVGRWQLTGFWRVARAEHRFDAGENRMLWRFTLKRVRRRVRQSNYKFTTSNL